MSERTFHEGRTFVWSCIYTRITSRRAKKKETTDQISMQEETFQARVKTNTVLRDPSETLRLLLSRRRGRCAILKSHLHFHHKKQGPSFHRASGFELKLKGALSSQYSKG